MDTSNFNVLGGTQTAPSFADNRGYSRFNPKKTGKPSADLLLPSLFGVYFL